MKNIRMIEDMRTSYVEEFEQKECELLDKLWLEGYNEVKGLAISLKLARNI